MSAEQQIFALSAIAAAVGLACSIFAPSDSQKPRTPQAAWLLAGMLIPGFFLMIMKSHIWLLQGGDEYSRIAYMHEWARNPFFASYDHIWPSGHFWMLGMAYRYFGVMAHAVAVTSSCGFLAMAAASFFLGKALWRSNQAGFFAAILIATHYVCFWIGTNPMAEVFALPSLLAAVALWVMYWDDVESTPVKRELKLLWAAAFISFGCSFRYELWYAGIILGAFMGFRMLYLLFGRRWAQGGIDAAGCVVLLLFPVAWMISCKNVLGSYIAFATIGTQMNADTNLFYDLSSPLSRFLLYPKALYNDHWFALPAVGTGLVMLLWKARRRASVAFLAAVASLLLVSMLVTMKTGIGSNSPPRYTMFIVILLLALGGGVFAPLPEAGPSKHRRGLFALSLILVLAISSQQLAIARRDYSHAWAEHPATLAMLARLSREDDGNRIAYADRRIQVPEAPLYVDCHDGNLTLYWLVLYYSSTPGGVIPMDTRSLVQYAFAAAPVGSHILVKKPHPNDLVITHSELLLDMEGYEVWRQLPGGSSPAAALTTETAQ